MNLINSLKVALYYKQNFATIPNKVGIENGLSNYFLCSHERKFVWNDTSLKNVSNEKTRTMCKICSKLTQKYQNDATDVALIFWLLILNRFNEVYFSNFRYSCFFPENIQIHSVIWHSSFFFLRDAKSHSLVWQNTENVLFIMLVVCSNHVTDAFQSESTLYSCLDVKELLARSRRKIWSLSDCIWTRTHNHLVHKRILNHLAKLTILASLAKWLRVRLWTKWFWVWVQLQSLCYLGCPF